MYYAETNCPSELWELGQEEVWEDEQSWPLEQALVSLGHIGSVSPGWGAEPLALALQPSHYGVTPAPKDRTDPISGAALPLPHWLFSLVVFSLGEVVWFCLSQIAVLGR